MKKIEYQQMTSSTFQTFCNILLWLELGDDFIGYEAPGRDGGIDGEYRGNYKKQSGKWRFQYKFHQTARKTAVNTLKADLTGEINKVGDEDYLVLLTNVALNPKERKELSLKARMLLVKAGKGKVRFDLWDDTVLQRLVPQYPLIRQWIDPDASSIFLLPYQSKFARQLNGPISALETLANTFISRQVELQSLKDFFESPDSTLLIIKGEAGIGKTRLAIEFFKQVVDVKQGWRALAINQYNLDINKLTKALDGNQNYIVLVDDAHYYSPAVLADLEGLSGKRGAHTTKFIFTMRSLQSYDAVSLISPFSKLASIELGTLTPEATKALLEQELSGLYLRHFIDELVWISRGRPILIVGILQAATTEKKITEIKSDSGFSDYVLRYFDDFLNRFVQQTGLERLKAKSLLKLCCLLEPFSYKDAELVRKIAEQEHIEAEFVDAFFSALGEAGLSTGNHTQAIRPDYYSDVYLQQNAKQEWVTRKMAQYKEFQSNILINLASIDEVENEKPEQLNSLLNQSLREYLGELKVMNSTAAVTERMELAASVAFQKPAIAITAVQDFTGLLNNPAHFLNAGQQLHTRSNYNPNSELVAYAKRVIRDVVFYPEHYEPAFQLLLHLHELTGEKDLFKTTFSFAHPTFLQQYSIRLQQFFVEKCKLLLPTADDKTALFLLECLKELLELRLDTSKWGLMKRHSISIQTHYLPKHDLIEKLRLTIVDVLTVCYHQQQKVNVRFDALHLILDIPRQIAANKSSPSHYESDAEIEKVLHFIENEADNFPTAFRKEVLDELYWYKKQRIKSKYFPEIDRLNERLQPRTLTQQVIQFLLTLEQEYVRSINKTRYEADFKELMAQHSPEAMADVLEEIWSSTVSQFHYFSGLIDMVCRHDVFYSKALYLHLKTKNRAFIYYYGDVFLRTFRCDEKMMLDFFQAEVAEYMETGTEMDLKTVLEVYNAHDADRITLTTFDKDVITTIFLRLTERLGIAMASALVIYYKQDPGNALKYIDAFLKSCNQDSASLLYWQLENEIPLSQMLESLLLKASIHFKIDHNIEEALIQIAKGGTPQMMFENFLQRYERKMLLHKTTKESYNLVPTGERDLFSESLEKDYRLSLFDLGLRWFVGVNGDWFEDLYAEHLLEYLRPDFDFTLACAVVYVQVGIAEKDNYPALFRLIESLKMFHTKTPVLMDTLGFLLRIAEKVYLGNNGFLKDVYFIGSQALTCVGCKSGTAGQPFECDVQLRELLMYEQPEYSTDFTMKNLIQYAIETVEDSIRQQCKEEEPVW